MDDQNINPPAERVERESGWGKYAGDDTGCEKIIIIGAGPAGLAAAFQLTRNGICAQVVEQSGIVGGIARTERYKQYYFDIGGHRFLTKFENIQKLWREMLNEDFRKVSRISRIFYNGKYYHYPVNLFNTLMNLGIRESLLIAASYLQSRIHPYSSETTFEQWVSNRFGKRLYQTFFKTYTEKVWGIPCNEIIADWAAQRIRGLSLVSAVANALFKSQHSKTLVNEFYYPLRGPGMMWEKFQHAIEKGGGSFHFNTAPVQLNHEKGHIQSVILIQNGKRREISVTQVVSTMPASRLVTIIEPAAPAYVIEAAQCLSFRAFVIVILIIDKPDLFPDQWIYIHNPEVDVGRIQNFKNWSSAMIPDAEKTSIGMEYFCSEGDDLWNRDDENIIRHAKEELSALKLAATSDCIEGFVIRQPNAYPVYDHSYRQNLMTVRDYLETFDNLQTIGRGGMHRYNNMDHSMLAGIMAAENILGASHDLWQVNEDAEYLEEGRGVLSSESEAIVTKAFARLDTLAFAVASGTVSGLSIFLATIWLVVKGGSVVGPSLALLEQYFFGYSVSIKGAFVAFGYAFFWGALFGWLFAYTRNFILSYYIYRLKRKEELLSFRNFIDSL